MTVSERDFINRIRAQSGGGSLPGLVTGIGDDCAVFACCENDPEGKLALVTSDALVDSVHFDLSWHPANLLGRKSLSVNISDIAAMGGRPLYALLTVGFPQTDMSRLSDDFMTGFYEVLGEHRMGLIGGDTVRSPNFFISVTVIGEVEKGCILYRSGAKEGDEIWVSGFLGHAAAGLEICRRGLHRAGQDEKMVAAHLDPTPQTVLGEVLGASGLVSAMMDISDGVATDLAHLCAESGVGAEVEEDLLPLSVEITETAGRLQFSALDWALGGGEDYQLLFTSSPSNRVELESLVKSKTGGDIFKIGRIVPGKGVCLKGFGRTREISYTGFDHFGSSK